MKAIYKKPGEAPKIIDIDNTLEALQEAVGGYIETVSLCSDVCLICNGEGVPIGMEFNIKVGGCPVFGPILIVGVKGDEFTDLPSPEAAARLFFGDGCL